MEKMSKSRGNVISPDEIIKGVYQLDAGYEFRDFQGQVVDWKKEHVFLQPKVGYWTHKKVPVCLHEVDNPVPVFLEGWSSSQHPDAMSYWLDLLEKYE